MADTTDYDDRAKEKAADAVRDMIDDVVEQLIDSGKAANSINDRKYGRTGEETESGWGDEHYTPEEAIKCLGDLDDDEADIDGMYDPKQGWRDMMSLLGALTFRNGCVRHFRDLIDEINRDVDVDEITESVKNEIREEKRPTFRQSAEVDLMAETDTENDIDADDINNKADEAIDEWMDAVGESEVKSRVKVKVEAEVKRLADEFHV